MRRYKISKRSQWYLRRTHPRTSCALWLHHPAGVSRLQELLMKRIYLGLLCGLLLAPAGVSAVPSPELFFRDNEVRADNGLISRRWKLVNGLPVPQSLNFQGHEWLKPDNKPGLVPPNGAPKPPLQVTWADDATPGDPVEAPSRRGALTVLGSDGRGYRWHLQLFADCPAVTCRLEILGSEHRTSNIQHPTR